MQIEFERGGGFGHFPGRRMAASVDTAELPDDEQRRLEELVERSGFFGLPDTVGGSAGAADARHYLISIEDAGARHAVRVEEPIEDDALEDLVVELSRLARGRPGPAS